jgi:hypothetical protein
MKAIIIQKIKEHIVHNEEYPKFLLLNPEDLAFLRDNLGLPFDKDLLRYLGLELIVKEGSELDVF